GCSWLWATCGGPRCARRCWRAKERCFCCTLCIICRAKPLCNIPFAGEPPPGPGCKTLPGGGFVLDKRTPNGVEWKYQKQEREGCFHETQRLQDRSARRFVRGAAGGVRP